jgi:hypothetical protein
MHDVHPLITNDATLFGILAAMLGAIFYTSKSEQPNFQKVLWGDSRAVTVLLSAVAPDYF